MQSDLSQVRSDLASARRELAAEKATVERQASALNGEAMPGTYVIGVSLRTFDSTSSSKGPRHPGGSDPNPVAVLLYKAVRRAGGQAD
jgi:hypothetical protein